MKIAVVGTRGVPATFGGVEKHCEELYAQIVKMGHEVTLYARKGYVDNNTDKYKGIKIVPLWTFKSKYLEASFHTFWALLHIIFSDADIIHFHAQGPSLFSLIPYFLSPRKKLVFTCHGLDWQRDKWDKLAKSSIYLGEIFSALFFDQQITVSKSLEDYYKEKHGIRTITIANGTSINPPKQAELIEEKFDLKKKNYILFIGRLVPEKAPHKLINAFKRINTDKKLVIAGGSSGTDKYEKYLKKIAKDDDRIIFTSYIYGEELEEIYSNAYLYVSVSQVEGMPLTLLEAMSYGIPVLVSNIQPHTEIIGKNEEYGYLFDTSKPVTIQKKLQQLLDLPEIHLAERGRKGLKLIKNKYSWKIAAKKLEAAYKLTLHQLR